MKRRIRLTESDLHKIIKVTVNNVLTESYWYGDTQPFETIYQMADKIVTSLENTVNDKDYEEIGGEFPYSEMYDNIF